MPSSSRACVDGVLCSATATGQGSVVARGGRRSSRAQPGLCVRRRRAHPGVPNISSGYSVVLRPRRLPRNRPKSSLRARRHKDEDTKTKRTRETRPVRRRAQRAGHGGELEAPPRDDVGERELVRRRARREAVGRLLGVAVHDLERDALEVREAVVDHGHARALGLVPRLPLLALLLVLLDRALAEDRPPDRQLARLVPAVV